MWAPNESADANEAVETERWCAGLVSVGTAPMDDDERAELGRYARALLVGALLLGFTGFAFVVWPFLVPTRLWTAHGTAADAAAAGLLASWVLGVPIAALWAIDCVRRYDRHAREWREGEIERFLGSLDGGRLDPEQRTLLKLTAFRTTPEGGQELRVFPRSGTVQVRDRRGRSCWRLVRVRTVAAAPGYLHRVTIPREAIGVDDPRVEILRRRMTADERHEVLARVASLQDAWKVLVLQALLLLIVFGMILRTAGGNVVLVVVPATILAALMAQRVRRPVDALVLARRLKRDAAAGLVLTHRRRLAARGRERTEQDDETSWVDVEFLPVSSLSWTVRGRPARWRDLVAPSWRLRLPWRKR
ncbi:MAG TPA: hypothetical protein VLV15_03730 [Dongiaceae bacterium]|nr:hypothetical protein [Dongiaceae bacterium]